MKKEFTKADLRSGQLVETRAGRVGLVILDEDRKAFVSPSEDDNKYIWGGLDSWKQDLFSCYHEVSDIVKVYDYISNTGCGYEKNSEERVLLWKREPEKTVSIKGKLYSETTILAALQEYCKK